MPLWIIAAFFSGISSIGSSITNRTSLKRWGDGSAYSWWFELGRASMALIIAIILGQSLRLSNPQHTVTLLLFGLFELISVVLFMKMHALTDLSISSVVVQLRLIWVPLIAYFFLGETLPAKAYLGIALIFIGALFVASPKNWHLDKGVTIAFITSIITAILSVLAKSVSSLAPSSVVIFWWSLPSIFLIPVIMPRSVSRIKNTWSHSSHGIIAAVLFNVVGMYLLLYALKLGPVSVVMSIYYSLNIMAAFFGIAFLKERDRILPKTIGAIFAILGAFLVL